MVRVTGVMQGSLTTLIDRDVGAGDYIETVGVLDVRGLDDHALMAWLASRPGVVGEVLPDDRFGDWSQ